MEMLLFEDREQEGALFALGDCKAIDLWLFYSLIYRQDICGIPEIMPSPGDNLLHNRSLCAAVWEKKNETNTAAGSCFKAPSMSFFPYISLLWRQHPESKAGVKTETYSFWSDGQCPIASFFPFKQKDRGSVSWAEDTLNGITVAKKAYSVKRGYREI